MGKTASGDNETVTGEADRWLRNSLRVSSLAAADLLPVLQDPGPRSGGFYTWLAEWAEQIRPRHRRDQFIQALAGQPCVRTTAGDWVAPSSGVFFPRERQADIIPDDLPIQIADLPEVPGLPDLMTTAGINPFRWREVLVHHVLPLLTSPATLLELRQRGHALLRSYLNTDDHNDQEVLKRLGDVLLLAKDAADTTRMLQPARSIYLGFPWAVTDDLERIYGPFGRCEFLAEPVSDDPHTCEEDTKYWLWLGVQTRPAVRVCTETSMRHRFADLPNHLFAKQQNLGPRWTEWTRSPALRQAYECGQNHPGSQQLAVSIVDRLHDLVTSGDIQPLRLLAKYFSRDWDHYRTTMDVTIRCIHQDHRGPRDRTVASMTRNLLTESAWLAAHLRGAVVLRRPREIWLPTSGLPAALRRHLMFLDPELDIGSPPQVWATLGVADAARPTAAHLIGLLRNLANDSTEVLSADIADVARWAMRHLNDALAHNADKAQTRDGGTPLLAILNGQLIFHTRPYVTDDPVFREIWGDACPILAADAGLTTLIQQLNLPHLADHVHIEPVADEHMPHESAKLHHELAQVLPYIEAVAVTAAPSRRDRVRRRLRHLEVIACNRLDLISSMDGHSRRHPVTAYVTRQPNEHNPSTTTVIYLQIDPQSQTPDRYALGPRLADLVDMPGQADAFTLLLTGDSYQRAAYLRSRGIPLPDGTPEEIDEEPEDDPHSEAGFPGPTPSAVDTPTPSAPPSQTDTTTAEPQTMISTAQSRQTLPPLDRTSYRIADAVTTAPADKPITAPELPNPAPTTGPPIPQPRTASSNRSPPDWHDLTKIAREYGKRGEEWAYLQERLRLKQRGLDPDHVVWVSRTNESADHDLRSIDDDEEPIFIEVKATSSTDPATQFEITGNELAIAHRHNHRYFIYQVLDVRSQTPLIIRYRDPLGLVAQGLAELHTSRAYMRINIPAKE